MHLKLCPNTLKERWHMSLIWPSISGSRTNSHQTASGPSYQSQVRGVWCYINVSWPQKYQGVKGDKHLWTNKQQVCARQTVKPCMGSFRSTIYWYSEILAVERCWLNNFWGQWVKDSHLAEEGFQTEQMPRRALHYIYISFYCALIECLATWIFFAFPCSIMFCPISSA